MAIELPSHYTKGAADKRENLDIWSFRACASHSLHTLDGFRDVPEIQRTFHLGAISRKDQSYLHVMAGLQGMR